MVERYPVAYKKQPGHGTGDFQPGVQDVVEAVGRDPSLFNRILKTTGPDPFRQITPQEFNDLVAFDGVPDLERARLDYLRKKEAEKQRTVAAIKNAQRFGPPSVFFEDRTGFEGWDENPWTGGWKMEEGDWPFKEVKGDFGGGGATGTWDWEAGEGVFADGLCFGGNRRYWAPQKVGANIFGPHDNGRFGHFYGFNLRAGADTSVWNFAGWQQIWNFAATGSLPDQPYSPGVAPGPCDTGICALPPPHTATSNQAYVERWLDVSSKVPSPNPPLGEDRYDVTTGVVWRRMNKACTGFTPRWAKDPEYPRWRDGVAPPGTQPDKDDPSEPEKRKRRRPPRPDMELTYRYDRGHVDPRVPGVGVPIVRRPPNSDKKIKVGKKEHEHKISLRSKVGRMWLWVNLATEIEDALRAMHNAMPKKCRAKPWQPDGSRTQVRHMLPHIYRCGKHVDFAQAIENLVNNEIADWYYGTLLGKPGKKLNQALQAPTGGTRLVGETVGKVLPKPPKVDLTDSGVGQYWIDIG